MFLRLLALFTVVPLLELFILVKLGTLVGVGPTIALVIVTGVLGAYLARVQGLGVVRRLRSELAEGRLPAEAVVDGLLILVAGAVLLTPGLLTDIVGFVLLVPQGRAVIRKAVTRVFARKSERQDPAVIDVEWRRED